jgi:hypothetical protein
VYRTIAQQCPRCGHPTQTIAHGVGCGTCGGRIVSHAAFLNMANDMLPLHCPLCQRPMRPCRLYNILLDDCSVHGIWFDAQELPATLMWFADAFTATFLAGLDVPNPQRPWLALKVTLPHAINQHRFSQGTVSIGNATESATLPLPVDDIPDVAAAIYGFVDQPPRIVDLGAGVTRVNGARIKAATLHQGDEIQIGSYKIAVSAPREVGTPKFLPPEPRPTP